MIQVNRPFLPPLEEYSKYIETIWDRNWLTNQGPLVTELESRLKDHLQCPGLIFVSNGTIAIQIAIKALALKGEIITTPFTYVATVSSIVWEGCTPVFVDIHPKSLNLDPSKIEAAITKNTSAIFATHVYGNPCDIDGIQKIASKHNLPVVYDAAHCFGTTYKGKSVFEYGNISATSFHATKLFHTVEGGALFTGDEELLKKLTFMRNFGHNGPKDFAEVGINGKNSEFHAAMGLANLKYIPEILASRKAQSLRYDHWLHRIYSEKIEINADSGYNYAYYPLILDSEETLLKVIKELEGNQVFPRRYFYPSLNTVNVYKSNPLPVSENVSKRIICLPLYHTLTIEEVDFISRLVLRACKL